MPTRDRGLSAGRGSSATVVKGKTSIVVASHASYAAGDELRLISEWLGFLGIGEPRRVECE
jgi:hypothetical protein